MRQDNLELVRGTCSAKVMEIVSEFQRNTEPKKLLFPLNEPELETRCGLWVQSISSWTVFVFVYVYPRRLETERHNALRTYTEMLVWQNVGP